MNACLHTWASKRKYNVDALCTSTISNTDTITNMANYHLYYPHPNILPHFYTPSLPTPFLSAFLPTRSLLSNFSAHTPLHFFLVIRTITFLLSYQTYSLSLSLSTHIPSLSTSLPPTRNFYHLTHTHIHARPHFLHSLKPTSWFRRCSWCQGTQTAQSPAEECCQRRNRTAGRCSSRRRGWTWGTGRSRRDTPIL